MLDGVINYFEFLVFILAALLALVAFLIPNRGKSVLFYILIILSLILVLGSVIVNPSDGEVWTKSLMLQIIYDGN